MSSSLTMADILGVIAGATVEEGGDVLLNHRRVGRLEPEQLEDLAARGLIILSGAPPAAPIWELSASGQERLLMPHLEDLPLEEESSMSATEAAEYLKCTRAHIHLLLRKGLLKGQKMSEERGAAWEIDPASVEAYILSRPHPGIKLGTPWSARRRKAYDDERLGLTTREPRIEEGGEQS